jgi:hypothetical protein
MFGDASSDSPRHPLDELLGSATVEHCTPGTQDGGTRRNVRARQNFLVAVYAAWTAVLAAEASKGQKGWLAWALAAAMAFAALVAFSVSTFRDWSGRRKTWRPPIDRQ